MTSTSYLRYPHLSLDVITFVAQDDVWLAPISGGRAWRLSSDGLPPRNPRLSEDANYVSWTVTRGAAPELVRAAVDGSSQEKLTSWGHASTLVKGHTPGGKILVTSAFEQADVRMTWAYAVDPESGESIKLPFGPVDSAAFGPVVGDERPVVVSSVFSREPAWWKRYRGGTGGKLWIDADGSGEFVRLVPELDGNLVDPLWVDGRIAFLSDHEGHGNLYSVRPDGSQLQRHTDFEGFYVRHASTDGHRVVFESAGNLFLLDGLDSEAVQLEITLGAFPKAARPSALDVADHLGEVVPNKQGSASLVEAYGTIHELTHNEGPARAVIAQAGVRARLPRYLDQNHAFYVSDKDGDEALFIVPVGSGRQSTQAAPDTKAGQIKGAGPITTDRQRPIVQDSETRELPTPVSAHAVNGAQFEHISEPVSSDESEIASSSPSKAEDTSNELSASLDGQRIDYPEPSRACSAVASPNGKFIAVGTEFGQVLIADVGSASMREVSRTSVGPIDHLTISPDSAWLVWVEPLGAHEHRSAVRMISLTADPAEIIELTDGRFNDHHPTFTPDGKFLAFLSERSFDPSYSSQSFDLAFPAATKPYLLALAATTHSPFGPSVDGQAPDSGTADKPESESVEVRVDLDGLAQRIIAVPVAQGRYKNLAAVEGKLLWQTTSESGTTGEGLATVDADAPTDTLESFELQSRKTHQILESVDRFAVSGNGQWIVAVTGDEIKTFKALADTSEGPAKKSVDLSRIVYSLDPVKAWGQAFDEAWKLQRDFFYAKDMAGIDWEAVYERYRPIVARLGSHSDLVDLLWELHGELGTSHAYVTPAQILEDGAGAQGFLGASFAKTENGWAITSILGTETSDPGAFSPLLAPGAGAKVGDVLEAINGHTVTEAGPAALLAGTAGKVVELVLRSDQGARSTTQGKASAVAEPEAVSGGTRRRIAVVPLKSEERLRYQEWVAANRALVHTASNGTFGYLHIPDMMANGWAQLHRDLDKEAAMDALVVDIRRNRGGHTSQLVAELIGRRMDAWSMVRHGEASIYPNNSPRGPVVLLADEFSGSDGDIITAVSKLRGIGPVVGMRTWGGVVGIDGRFDLADGTAVTQPRYAYWFRGGQGFNVENYGVDPDIAVPFPPHEHAAGNDPQLDAAIGVLREMQQEIPTVRPPAFSGYRDASAPKLPPRPKS